jgi:hypothetical protein
VLNIANRSKSTSLSELIFSAKNADNNDESKSRAENIEDIILDKMIWHENIKDILISL